MYFTGPTSASSFRNLLSSTNLSERLVVKSSCVVSMFFSNTLIRTSMSCVFVLDCFFKSPIRLLIGLSCEPYCVTIALTSLVNCALILAISLSALVSLSAKLLLASLSALRSSVHEKQVLSCSLIDAVSSLVVSLYCANLVLILLMSVVACVLYWSFSLSIVLLILARAISSRLIKLSTRVLPISPDDKRVISVSQRLILVSKRTIFSSSTSIFATCRRMHLLVRYGTLTSNQRYPWK